MQRLYCLETLAGCNQKVLNANEILWWSALHIKAVDRNLVDGNPLWRSFPDRDSDQFEFVKSCQVFGGGLSLARFSGLSLGRCHEAEKWCGLGMRRRAPEWLCTRFEEHHNISAFCISLSITTKLSPFSFCQVLKSGCGHHLYW